MNEICSVCNDYMCSCDTDFDAADAYVAGCGCSQCKAYEERQLDNAWPLPVSVEDQLAEAKARISNLERQLEETEAVGRIMQREMSIAQSYYDATLKQKSEAIAELALMRMRCNAATNRADLLERSIRGTLLMGELRQLPADLRQIVWSSAFRR